MKRLFSDRTHSAALSHATGQCSIIGAIFSAIFNRSHKLHADVNGVGAVLSSVSFLFDCVNDPEMFQEVHVVENLARTHAFSHVWSHNPGALADIDTGASAGGYIHGLAVRSSLFVDENFRRTTGAWIATGLRKLQAKYSAPVPHGSLPIHEEMTVALAHLETLFLKWA